MNAHDLTRRRLILSLLTLLAFAVLGTAGFFLLGQSQGRTLLESLYLTAVIFSTVGLAAQNVQLSQAEQLWVLLLILFGISAATYALSNIMALVTSGEIQRMLGRRQLSGKVKTLENHFIVCGFGRMGQGVCRTLARENVDFVLVDKSSDKTARADELGYLYLLGDASDENVLRMAGIHRARGLVTVLSRDAENVFVTLTARGLNPKLTIVARSEQEETEHRILRAGADRVICPQTIGATKITRMLLHPAVEVLLDATTAEDLSIDKIKIDDLKDLIGQTLRDLGLPRKYGLMVLAVENAQSKRVFNPPADHIIVAGDQLIVIGARDAIERLVAAHE